MTGIQVVRDRVVFSGSLLFLSLSLSLPYLVMVTMVNGGDNFNLNTQVGLRAALWIRAVCADKGTHKDAANNTMAILSACMRGKVQMSCA